MSSHEKASYRLETFNPVTFSDPLAPFPDLLKTTAPPLVRPFFNQWEPWGKAEMKKVEKRGKLPLQMTLVSVNTKGWVNQEILASYEMTIQGAFWATMRETLSFLRGYGSSVFTAGGPIVAYGAVRRNHLGQPVALAFAQNPKTNAVQVWPTVANADYHCLFRFLSVSF